MSDSWRTLAVSPRLNALASVLIGALFVGLSQIMTDASPLAVPALALLVGGGLLFGVGILGAWQPERFGVKPRNPWLGVSNGIAILLLLAALVLHVV